MCSEYGVYVVHLPPYSPDYNPIEKGFGIAKDHLRRSEALTSDLCPEEEIEEIYLVAEEVFTPEMIHGLYEGSVWL
jgi:transposase